MRPVGEIDVLFDAGGVEVAVGKAIECVAGEIASREFGGKVSDAVRGRKQLIDHGAGEPQSGRHGPAQFCLTGTVYRSSPAITSATEGPGWTFVQYPRGSELRAMLAFVPRHSGNAMPA